MHRRMLEQGWQHKPGVRIIFARWQDCLHDLGSFDGIFFDTFSGLSCCLLPCCKLRLCQLILLFAAEHYEDLR